MRHGPHPALRATFPARGKAGSGAYHKFLPSITVTGNASRSKSSSTCALTDTRGLAKSGSPLDQSGDSENVVQPHVAQK